MTIHCIESFEVVALHDDGEILITTNFEPGISYPDEGEVIAQMEGLNLVVQAPVPFRLVGVPPRALRIFAHGGKVRFAEIDAVGEIARFAWMIRAAA